MFVGKSQEERSLAGEEAMGGNDHLVVARDHRGRPQLFRTGDARLDFQGLDLDEAMPFRNYPGVPAPKDALTDHAIFARLRQIGAGELPQKGAVLDYTQSETLFNTANDHFENSHPLMNTERWLAGFVERNDLTYTDHDGRRYKMKKGQRYPVT